MHIFSPVALHLCRFRVSRKPSGSRPDLLAELQQVAVIIINTELPHTVIKILQAKFPFGSEDPFDQPVFTGAIYIHMNGVDELWEKVKDKAVSFVTGFYKKD